jgi:hypothetical protein
MKSLKLSTIVVVCIIVPGMILPHAFSESMDGIVIVDTDVQPPTILSGDTFTINATLVNNSTNVINVKNSCGGPFSVSFDAHAKVELKKVCNWMPIQIILQPGENITGSSLFSNLAYRATSPGIVNATVTFSYVLYNKTSNLSLDTDTTNISKPFIFAIYDTYGGLTMSSPLVQFKSGIAANNIKCHQGFQLVIKAENGHPACVRSQTAQTLVDWGWAKMPGQ